VSATIRPLTGDGSPPVEGAYPQAVEVTAPTRWLYLSGQIPVAPDGSLAADARRFVAADNSLAPLAVAVHNAGSNNPAPFLKVSEAQFEAHWREHTLGGFQTAQAVIPAFL
jgi:enamine deaminase RidA (YjgF/YER057c/UK114 family)